jgi:ubiquinone biosynthesis protein
MLKADLIPTPLVATRDAVPIVASRPPQQFPVLIISARLLWWCATVLALRLTQRDGAAEYGRRFRELLESLGGLWIKLGQLLSLRVDLFPLEFCRELAQLQINVSGFPVSEAVAILEADLGRPLDAVFADFDRVPLAAASMGQVHLARLRKSGVRVAVKVQRPHLPAIFTHQLRVIQSVIWVVKLVRYRPNLRWDELIWELAEIMKEEMDCRYEGSTTRRMRRTLRPHGIYAPRVFHATARVLVTEFIDGVLMAEYIQVLNRDPGRVNAWLAENGVDPDRVGRRLIVSLLRQIQEDNLFHGDLHPGNIMLLRNSKVALIDFGACSFTEREYLQRFRLTVRALADGSFDKAADLTLLLCGALPRVNLDGVKEGFVQAMRIWAAKTGVAGVPYHEKSVAVIYNDVIRILYEHDATMEWALLRIRRAQETLDASLLYLVPDVNYRTLAKRYFRAADSRAAAMRPDDARKAELGSSLDTALTTIERFDEFTLLQGASIRRQARRFETAATDVGNLFAAGISRLAIAGAIGAALLVSVFLAQRYPAAMTAIFGGVLTGWLRIPPVLDAHAWTIVLSASGLACAALLRLRRRLQRFDMPVDRVAYL